MKNKIIITLTIVVLVFCTGSISYASAGEVSPYVGIAYGPGSATQTSSYTSSLSGNVFNTSISGGITYENLRAELAYSVYSTLDDYISIKSVPSARFQAETKNMNSVLFNAFYYFPGEDAGHFFIGAGTGFTKSETIINVSGVPVSGTSPFSLTFAIYGGFTANLSDKFSVDAFAKYMWVDSDMQILGESIKIKTSAFGLGLGLRFKI